MIVLLFKKMLIGIDSRQTEKKSAKHFELLLSPPPKITFARLRPLVIIQILTGI